jgi:putative oxidoreductase
MTDDRTAPLGLFTLRVALGVMYVAHGLLKVLVFTPTGFAGFLAKTGNPEFLAWPIIVAEIVGGVALILGVYSRHVAAVLLPILIGAFFVHLPAGWQAGQGGWEYVAFLIAASLTVILSGEGAYALKRAELPGFVSRLVPQPA